MQKKNNIRASNIRIILNLTRLIEMNYNLVSKCKFKNWMKILGVNWVFQLKIQMVTQISIQNKNNRKKHNTNNRYY